MTTFDAVLDSRLAALAERGISRSLTLPDGLDFSSNDYLGLAADAGVQAEIRARIAALPDDEPLGAPSSRLLRGHFARHAALEERLAAWRGTESALLFPSGYQANVGLLSSLIEPCDRAITDAQNHASLIDGLRLSGCRKVIVPHLDLGAIETALAKPHPRGRTFVVTESLYSMDGDIAPLDSYAELCGRHGAELIVDDAHAAGVYGDHRGSGLIEAFGVERGVVASIATFGKALGFAGACVAGSRTLVDFLVNRCRSFIFSTAMAPLGTIAINVALDSVAAEPQRRRRVLALSDRLRERVRALGLDPLESTGPIVPVILGDNERAVAVAARLRVRGFDVRAIRPPTVAAGTARLRISVHANRTEAEIDALAVALGEAVAAEQSA